MPILTDLIVRLATAGMPQVKAAFDAVGKSVDTAKNKIKDFQNELAKLRVQDTFKIEVDISGVDKLRDALRDLKNIQIKPQITGMGGGAAGEGLAAGLAAGGVGLLGDIAMLRGQQRIASGFGALGAHLQDFLKKGGIVDEGGGRISGSFPSLSALNVHRLPRPSGPISLGGIMDEGSGGVAPPPSHYPSPFPFPPFPVPSSYHPPVSHPSFHERGTNNEINAAPAEQLPSAVRISPPTGGRQRGFAAPGTGAGEPPAPSSSAEFEIPLPPDWLQQLGARSGGGAGGGGGGGAPPSSSGSFHNISSIPSSGSIPVVIPEPQAKTLGQRIADWIGKAKQFASLMRGGVMRDTGALAKFFRDKVVGGFNDGNKKIKDLVTGLGKGEAALKAWGALGKDFYESISRSFSALLNLRNIALVGIAASLAKIAAPVDFGFLQAELTILGRSIGRILIPYIRQAEESVKRLSAWFDSLSFAQRENIRWWLALGAKIVIVITALTVGYKVIVGMATAFGMLKAAISSTWALAAAHPWLAVAVAIAAVTGAILAMTGAFSTVGDTVANAAQKIQELEQLLNKLRKGGVPNAAELRQTLSPEDYKRIVETAGDPAKQIKILREIQEREEKRRQGYGNENQVEQRALKIEERAKMPVERSDELSTLLRNPQQRELEQLMTEQGMETKGIGNRAGHRFGRIRGGLVEQGVSEDEATRIAVQIMARLAKKGLADKYKFSESEAKEAGDIFREMVRRSEAIREAAKKGILEKGFDLNKKKDENDVPRMFAQVPALMNIADAWRKAQMAAQGETPEIKLRQDMLKRMMEGNHLLENIDKNTKHPHGLG